MKPKSCCLCVSVGIKLIPIDNGPKYIATVLSTHFWFQTFNADEQICYGCWQSTEEFHKFYSKIWRLHNDQQALDEISNFNLDSSKSRRAAPPLAYVHVPDVSAATSYSCDNEEIIAYELPTEIEETALVDESNSEYLIPVMNKTDGSASNFQRVESENLYLRNEEVIPKLESITDRSAPCKNIQSALVKTRASQQDGKLRKAKKVAQGNRRDATEFSETDNANIRSFFDMICKMCETHFNDFKEAQDHYRDAHGSAGFIYCCDKKFRRPCEIKDHIQKHLQPESFRCDQCCKLFASHYALNHHCRFQHSMNYSDKEFKCEICPKSYRLKRYLSTHVLTAHRTDANESKDRDKLFGCDCCARRFMFKSSLRKHLLAGHENGRETKTFMCEICAKILISKTGYDMHLLKHAGQNAMPIVERLQCDICGAWVNRKTSLVAHMARHREKPIACSLCGKKLPNRESLRNHMRVHSERPHNCVVCGKYFCKLQTLKDHMSLHTGQPQHKCPFCPREFNSNSNMYTHRKKIHPIEWQRERRADHIVMENYIQSNSR